MLRRITALLCIPSNVTLTSRLAELASRVANPSAHKDIWTEVESTSHFARSLKETDTLLAVVFRLLRNGNYPPPPPALWPTLIRNLAPFSDVEATAVLAYPGLPDCPDDEIIDSRSSKHGARQGALQSSSPSLGEELEDEQWWADAEHPGAPSLLRATRETLLMTGGVVPLSARAPCSDGAAFGRLLNAFSDAHAVQPFDTASLQSVSAAVAEALQWMAAAVDTRESSPLACAILRFMGLLVAVESNPSLAEDFAARLIGALPARALGARWLARFLALHHAEAPDALLRVPLAMMIARGVWRRCDALDAGASCVGDLRHIYGILDMTLQRNANSGNPLGMSQEEESEARLLLTIALLRAMRLQSAAAPDAFLRDAVDIVERSPVSLAIEYELLAAKVQLLDLFAEDAESSAAIYDDLLQSLRAIVELRNRDTVEEANTVENKDAGMQKNKAYSIHKSKSEEKSLYQDQFQEAHRLVVDAFARSHLDERLNQAYTILVAHKYHELVITTAIAHPLLDALSKRGDCRVFNIVDLCVLYSGCSIDYETVSYLFRACRVAGDHYRARTLYQLLREMMPGFLLKAPSEVREALRELKVLDPEPAHMFPSVLDSDADELTDAVMNDEAMALTGKRQWGPMRELPTVQATKESNEGKAQSSHRHRQQYHAQKMRTANV